MTELLSDGITLMLLGMGIVFTFLGMLVLSMYGMSWLARRLEPAVVETPTTLLASTTGTGTDNEELVAVIGAAIHRYRHRN